MVRLAVGALATVVVLAAVGGAAPASRAVVPKPPTAATCPPPFTMESLRSLPPYDKVGEFQLSAATIVKTYPPDPYHYKCVYLHAEDRGEAFVVFFDLVTPGLPGRIPSGDCGHASPDPLRSDKRYVSVAGGERRAYTQAAGGNAKILLQALARAEAQGVGQACTAASTPPPQPAPPPSPPATPPPPKPTPPASSGDLVIDYRLADRFGLPGPNGMIRYHDEQSGEIRPAYFHVQFTVERKDGRACEENLVRFSAETAIRSGRDRLRISQERPDKACWFYADYKREGRYSVEATLNDPGSFLTDPQTLEGRLRFPLQDWLIVGLGDSNGSGEGAPDVSKRLTVRWQDAQCHRSALSYQAQAALRIENEDEKTSVTFVHLACSGATIEQGLLGKYAGIDPSKGRPPGKLLRAQVKEMRRLIKGREVDAMMVSIGVNDLRFGSLVAFCIEQKNCPEQKFPEESSPATLAQEMLHALAQLPDKYAKVAAALRAAKVKRERIYFSEYFDSTKDALGTTCDPLIRVYHPKRGILDFDRAEAQWAHDEVLVPLNKAVRTATERHGWGYIGGAYDAFREHGYCAKPKTRPKERQSWIVALLESVWRQYNKEGTLHSTPRGNEAQAEGAFASLRAGLYPNDRARQPRTGG